MSVSITTAAQVASTSSVPELYSVAVQVIPVLILAIVFQARFALPTLPVGTWADLMENRREIKSIEQSIDDADVDQTARVAELRSFIAEARSDVAEMSGPRAQYFARRVRLAERLLNETVAEAQATNAELRARLKGLRRRSTRFILLLVVSPVAVITYVLIVLAVAAVGEFLALGVLTYGDPDPVDRFWVNLGITLPFVLLATQTMSYVVLRFRESPLLEDGWRDRSPKAEAKTETSDGQPSATEGASRGTQPTR